MSVIIETTIGDIIIDLYYDERPNCCKNFLKLCKMKYYHYCLFHNVQKNFIAQTGDPTGTGRGGESLYFFAYGEQAKYFEREFIPKIKHKKIGCVSMINNGDDKHGSQFLITLDRNLDYLDGKHTVFGEIAKGFDVIEKLNECITDKEGRPFQDIRICHTIILDDPFEDIGTIDNPRKSPVPTDELIDSDRIRCDEDIDLFEGKAEEEINQILDERETKKRAKVLEIIGDIPDADIKPPENVLFVCKLNPVTTDADLELIFSRFGPIKSCEVIRDRKSGDSLCYAFIEFENEEDCENAYFKMDNVLIDDRRIHVDFSQSVSKVWKGKGTGTGYFEDNRRFDKDDDERPSNNYKIKHTKIRQTDKYEYLFDENESAYDKTRYKEHDSSRRDHRHHYHNNKKHDYDRGRDRDHDRDRDNGRGGGDRGRDRDNGRGGGDRDRDRDYNKRKNDRDYDRHGSSDRKKSSDSHHSSHHKSSRR